MSGTIEDQARSMGWVPQEDWKGDPDKWTSAEEYVERGEQIIPIMRANNRALRDDVLTLKAERDTIRQELDVTKAIVQGLEKQFNASLEAKLKEQRQALKASLKDAVEDRDVDRELELREQLDELSEAERESKRKQEENREKLKSQKHAPTDTDLKVSPDFTKWKQENSWFGGDSAEDKKRTRAVVRAAEDLRDEGDTSEGYEFFNKALERVEGKNDDTPVDKVDVGSSRSNSRGNSGSQSFNSLPPEAKAACLEDMESFVGEGKLYKTEKEWKDYYAKVYYGS